MIENIRDRFTAGIKPLYDYLESFREFKDVLQLNPDEFTRNIEMMENPWEVEQMQDEIFKVIFFQRNSKYIRGSINNKFDYCQTTNQQSNTATQPVYELKYKLDIIKMIDRREVATAA